MKKHFLTILSCTCLIAVSPISAQTKKSKSTLKFNKMTSKEVVQSFFSAFGKGDSQGVMNAFDEHVKIVGVREAERKGQEIYGTYHGTEGVQAFLTNMSHEFDTKAFSVENIMGEGDISFANGKMTHQLKSTGKLFSSDWALMCVVKNNKIVEYHFYEDSAKFVEAASK